MLKYYIAYLRDTLYTIESDIAHFEWKTPNTEQCNGTIAITGRHALTQTALPIIISRASLIIQLSLEIHMDLHSETPHISDN